MRTPLRAGVLLALLPLVLSAPATVARAQGPIAKSQLATVSQLVGPTRLELVYRRPVARGRALFGALVPWGAVWTPSADTAARFSASTAIDVDGHRLPAGTYSIWMIPDSLSFTVIFNAVGSVFHLRYPSGRDVLRVQARPSRGDHVESLLFAFPMVDADSARLELRWGTTIVPLSIRSAP